MRNGVEVKHASEERTARRIATSPTPARTHDARRHEVSKHDATYRDKIPIIQYCNTVRALDILEFFVLRVYTRTAAAGTATAARSWLEPVKNRVPYSTDSNKESNSASSPDKRMFTINKLRSAARGAHVMFALQVCLVFHEHACGPPAQSSIAPRWSEDSGQHLLPMLGAAARAGDRGSIIKLNTFSRVCARYHRPESVK